MRVASAIKRADKKREMDDQVWKLAVSFYMQRPSRSADDVARLVFETVRDTVEFKGRSLGGVRERIKGAKKAALRGLKPQSPL